MMIAEPFVELNRFAGLAPPFSAPVSVPIAADTKRPSPAIRSGRLQWSNHSLRMDIPSRDTVISHTLRVTSEISTGRT